jgi:hypothetical protein
MPDDRSAPVPRSAPPRDPSRPSLREIAERSAAAMPRSQRPGGTAGGARGQASRPARPRDDENTGYVEVGELRSLFLASGAKATDPTAGPAREEPAREEDDATRVVASVPPASQTSLAYARSEPPGRAARVATSPRASGLVLGAAIALIGIGGSALWVVRTSAARAGAAQTAVERAPATVASIEPGAPAATEPMAPPVAAHATAPEAEPGVEPPAAPGAAAPTSTGDGVVTLALVDVPGTRPHGAPGAGANNPPAAPRANATAAGASRAPTSKPSDLAAAIAAAAAGPAATAATPAPIAAPAPPASTAKAAATGGEQPSQAAVRASISAVKGAAKACIADADDTSRAQITFAPSGTVTQVVVSGWAAEAGVGGCVKNALKTARVEPFSGPPFTVGVTLRP